MALNKGWLQELRLQVANKKFNNPVCDPEPCERLKKLIINCLCTFLQAYNLLTSPHKSYQAKAVWLPRDSNEDKFSKADVKTAFWSLQW